MKEVLPVLFSPTSKVRGAKRAVCSSRKQRKFFRVILFTVAILSLPDGCQQYQGVILIFVRVQDSKDICKHCSPVFCGQRKGTRRSLSWTFPRKERHRCAISEASHPILTPPPRARPIKMGVGATSRGFRCSAKTDLTNSCSVSPSTDMERRITVAPPTSSFAKARRSCIHSANADIQPRQVGELQFAHLATPARLFRQDRIHPRTKAIASPQ